MIVVIALSGFVMYAVRAIFFAHTVYSPGYDESRFQQIRVRMTAEEVEALMGPPLSKVPWPEYGIVIWLYTKESPGYSNYWRRDIFMKDDKVFKVNSTFWID